MNSRNLRIGILIFACMFWLSVQETNLLGFAQGMQLEATQGSGVGGGEFTARVYTNARGETMPYRLFVPAKYDPSKKYPLVMWLHGGVGRGSDNLKQISGGNTLGAGIWTRAENQEKNPVFVLALQCSDNQVWANRGKDEMTDALRLALEIVDAVQKEFSVDAQRIYAAGQSMGGGGTWDVLARRPELFAAAVPLCGPTDVSTAAKIAHIPVWVFHGTADTTVPVDASRRMVEALRAAGAQPKYTEFPGVGHAVWEKAFQEPGLVEWVMAQKRAAKP